MLAEDYWALKTVGRSCIEWKRRYHRVQPLARDFSALIDILRDPRRSNRCCGGSCTWLRIVCCLCLHPEPNRTIEKLMIDVNIKKSANLHPTELASAEDPQKDSRQTLAFHFVSKKERAYILTPQSFPANIFQHFWRRRTFHDFLIYLSFFRDLRNCFIFRMLFIFRRIVNRHNLNHTLRISYVICNWLHLLLKKKFTLLNKIELRRNWISPQLIFFRNNSNFSIFMKLISLVHPLSLIFYSFSSLLTPNIAKKFLKTTAEFFLGAAKFNLSSNLFCVKKSKE